MCTNDQKITLDTSCTFQRAKNGQTPHIPNKNSFPLVQTEFTFVPFIRKLPKIFISLRLVCFYLCYGQCFCVNPDLSCSRLFVEWRLENRHFVIVLSHCASPPPMCWCLPYALISFPLGQMADTGFQHCFPNTLFVLDCNLFNFPVVMPNNELYLNINSWIVHTLSLDLFSDIFLHTVHVEWTENIQYMEQQKCRYLFPIHLNDLTGWTRYIWPTFFVFI